MTTAAWITLAVTWAIIGMMTVRLFAKVVAKRGDGDTPEPG